MQPSTRTLSYISLLTMLNGGIVLGSADGRPCVSFRFCWQRLKVSILFFFSFFLFLAVFHVMVL